MNQKKDIVKRGMWIIMVLSFFFCFISMYYSDIWQTYHDSLTLLDCIREGKFLEYYEINKALYFIPCYIIFGIWNLPVWVLSRFWGVNADSVGCFLWSKGIVLLFAIGCIWMIYCILKKLEYGDLEYTLFLFVSSLFFAFPVMVATQYDVVELFFLLSAMYYYAKDQKLSWRFLLFFSVAISIKYFAVFIFFLVVLIEEKRILCIVRNMFLGVLFAVISMLPFWTRGYWNGLSGHNIGFAYRLLVESIPGGLSPISIFLLGYFMLCATAYFLKKKSIKENFRFIIWLSTAFFMLLFTFVDCHPYWIVLYLPFMIIMIKEYQKNLKVNILFETIMEIVMILMQGMLYNWVYFSGNLFGSLLIKPKRMNQNVNLRSFLGIGEEAVALCLVVANTVFFACEIILLVVNNPWKPVVCESTEEELMMTMKISRVVRTVIIVLLLGLTLFIVLL